MEVISTKAGRHSTDTGDEVASVAIAISGGDSQMGSGMGAVIGNFGNSIGDVSIMNSGWGVQNSFVDLWELAMGSIFVTTTRNALVPAERDDTEMRELTSNTMSVHPVDNISCHW